MFHSWSQFCSVLLLPAIAAIGAGAVSKTVADWPAAYFTWKIAFCFYVAFALGSTWVWTKQTKSVRYVFMAKAVMMLSLSSMLFAIGLPAFFVAPVSSLAGAGLLLTATALLIAHVVIAVSHFRNRWNSSGPTALRDATVKGRLDVEKFRRLFPLSAPNIVQPGSTILGLLFPAIVLALLIAGLNLRKVFPEFSAFAWGLGSTFGLTWLAQEIVLQFLQAKEISFEERRTARALLAAKTD